MAELDGGYEESYDDYEEDAPEELDARGDFTDGSRANGTGRGDPGIDPTEHASLRAERDRLAERARILDDFERDPERIIRDVASRMGLDLVPRGSGNQDQNGHGQPPREFVEQISRSLSPEYAFLADELAKGMWTANQEGLKPIREQQASERMRERTRERDAVVSEMDQKYPAWRQALPDMEAMYNFIRESADNGSMKHPKYGSLQECLYKLVTGDSRATRTAVERMRGAAQNASSSSEGGRDQGADIFKQMRNTKDRTERFKMAWNQALHEHGVR